MNFLPELAVYIAVPVRWQSKASGRLGQWQLSGVLLGGDFQQDISRRWRRQIVLRKHLYHNEAFKLEGK